MRLVNSGLCGPQEVCTQSRSRVPPKAFCVSNLAIVNLAITQTQQAGNEQVPNPQTVPGGTVLDLTSEAILMDESLTTEYNASSIGLQAYGLSNDRFQNLVPLANGASQCTDCPSTMLDPVPAGTVQMAGQVVLETAGLTAVLVLSTAFLGG